jgi:hypothetical protein
VRQKTKNYQNQGSTDKKFDFFPQSLSHIPRWVHLVQKTRAKNSHAWAPLTRPPVVRETLSTVGGAATVHNTEVKS